VCLWQGEALRINPFASLFAASLIIQAPVRGRSDQQTQSTAREEISVRDRVVEV
jgi:hypothetical protein